MNIIAGDLFTHLSVCIGSPDVDARRRILYERALSELQDLIHFCHDPELQYHRLPTNAMQSRIGQLFYEIFWLEQQPDDETGSFETDE
jgi:hypothetical protein